MDPTQEHDTTTTYDRRAEVEALLAADETLLGRYWRYLQEGISKEEVAEREGVPTTGWTSNYDFLVRNIRDGRIAKSPSGARQYVARIRSWGPVLTRC